MKYKTGDKVKVKNSLVVNCIYGGLRFEEYMYGWKNKTLTIDEVMKNGYTLAEDVEKWMFSEEMLKPVYIKPRICEILGVEVGQLFKIKGLKSNVKWRVTNEGSIKAENEVLLGSVNLSKIINTPSLIEIIQEYTNEQWLIFESLKLCGVDYLFMEENGYMYISVNKPTKKPLGWFISGNWAEVGIHKEIYKYLKDLVSWEDEYPFEIPTKEVI